MTIYWAPLLHVYQPPWQDVDVLKRIYNESYLPLLSMMERHENMKITLNIQGCLLDQFSALNLREPRKITQRLLAEEKVELVGSAKYHPILPLIPKPEIIRQIRINTETLAHHFPSVKLRGFFPPEMAVSSDLDQIVKDTGYEWLIADGIANGDAWPHSHVQRSPTGLITLFRDSYLSNMISFNKISATGFLDHLSEMYEDSPDQDHYIITAQDAETFGHHIKYYETAFLGKVFSLLEDRDDIKVVFLSDLLALFPIIEGSPMKSSSWSTDGSDLASNVPFPLWQHPLNPVHKYMYRMLTPLYQLMEMAEREGLKDGSNGNFQNYYSTARFFYDQALHSCWLWWGAGSTSTNGMWSPNLIYKGIDLILKAALNAQLALIGLKIGNGDVFYSRIIDNSEKLMNELITQEAAGQRVRTFGDF